MNHTSKGAQQALFMRHADFLGALGAMMHANQFAMSSDLHSLTAQADAPGRAAHAQQAGQTDGTGADAVEANSGTRDALARENRLLRAELSRLYEENPSLRACGSGLSRL
jgi:hypothetical protein